MIGKRVLNYRIIEQLGKGGMGEVYLAEDTKLGRRVAVKFLPASYRYDPDRRARFMKEARSASSLSSPNIAAIHEISESEDSIFIVMEYVEGETLAHRIESGPVPVREAIGIAMQLADALDEAHTRGVIHRDIKSANAIITARGLVKLLDFGLAKLTESFQDAGESDITMELGGETAAGVVLGTVSYMSPEQALGRPLDHRSDIFSLGVVIYEMLTARLPFEGESATEIVDRIVHHEAQAIARFNYEVSTDLERIVRKTLEKNPDFRYQSARELYIDLSTLGRDLDSADLADSLTHILETDSGAVHLKSEPAQSNAESHSEYVVAVMTFSNITKESADEWIGAGIAETVSADLKNIRGLTVIGRERIFETLKRLDIEDRDDIDEKFATRVGRGLGAGWIICGGYQRLGELIRITARVVDVDTGALFKAVKIDGSINDIFALQDKIVYEMSQGMKLELDTSDLKEMEGNKSNSVEAYECFSRGIINIRNGSLESLDRAIVFFERAIKLDPDYASAWAVLGAAHDIKGTYLSLPELSSKTVEFEKKALELSPRLSDAHGWLGSAYASLGRYDEAIETINEALRLDPNNDTACLSLARAYWMGKGMIEEGIATLERAAAINPQSGYAYLQLGFLYTLCDDYARAEKASRKAIKLQEGQSARSEGLHVVGAYIRLGDVFYRQGRCRDAICEYERERASLASSDHALRERSLIELNQKLGAAHLRVGQTKEAELYFDLALKSFKAQTLKGANEPFTEYFIACLYALRGDADSAFKYLEASFAQLRAFNRERARSDTDLDNIRNDPRFIKLMESVE